MTQQPIHNRDPILTPVPIAELRPTQITVGMREVDRLIPRIADRRPRWLTWAAINRRIAFQDRAQTADSNAGKDRRAILFRWFATGHKPTPPLTLDNRRFWPPITVAARCKPEQSVQKQARGTVALRFCGDCVASRVLDTTIPLLAAGWWTGGPRKRNQRLRGRTLIQASGIGEDSF
jgi:hypothetical protein